MSGQQPRRARASAPALDDTARARVDAPGDDLAALGEWIERLSTYCPPDERPAGDRVSLVAIAEGLAALGAPTVRSK